MADVQRLKKAEEEATKQVDSARKDRAATLRKARAEAEAEISAYRKAQMQKLEDLQTKQSSNADTLSKLSEKAEADVETLKKDVTSNKQKVIERLLEVTTSVNLSVPEARKGLRAK
mmetsp:Transcript_20861/g.30933  ORF Transcript_20861/g.30933 Transcript_20861/m.30933 type:complete len:116 (+) Transcript_20861:132-479(+)